jgi:hypothetical protein
MRRNLSISGFPRWVSNQNAIPHHAAENNEVIIAEGVIGTASGTLSTRPLKVTLFGAGAALAGGRAASSRRGGWPEPSGVELLGRLAIVADSLASARPSEPAFAAMAIPAKNAVPQTDGFTDSRHIVPLTFPSPRRSETERIAVRSEVADAPLELLRVRLPEASTVVLSDRDNVDDVNRALAHGVRRYIPTSSNGKLWWLRSGLSARVAPLFRQMRCARQPQSGMTNRKVNGRGDRTDGTSRRVSFR